MDSIISKIIIIVTSVLASFGIGGFQDVQPDFASTTNDMMATTAEAKSSVHVYTQEELLKMAGPKPTSLPLGDGKYVTKTPKVGYIYLCNAHTGEDGGAQGTPTWITGTSWDPSGKPEVEGKVSWPNATFKNVISGIKRLITGNDLPLNHTTGTYPINRNSEAGKFDQNPNSIKSQNLSYSLPASPTYKDTPNCMGGESGIMLSGVAIFNGFDAGLRDAQAHEVQDSCSGHPQKNGEYHYHGMSKCFSDISVQTVLGYALDGFPITGPKVSDGKYLATKNLDVCHGLTSEIIVDGKKKTTYHYVLTDDFPYSVSCFRGTPIKVGPGGQGGMQNGQQDGTQNQGGMQTPPQPALQACTGKADNSSCTVNTPNGTLTGTCHNTPDNKYFACVPNKN